MLHVVALLDSKSHAVALSRNESRFAPDDRSGKTRSRQFPSPRQQRLVTALTHVVAPCFDQLDERGGELGAHRSISPTAISWASARRYARSDVIAS
jgi:hypothetical protein